MPELADQGIFQLTWLHVNCYVKMMKKYPLRLNLTDFMKILSVPQDYCGIHNNLRKIFSKNYTLQGVYISDVVQSSKELLFRFQFYKFIGKSLIQWGWGITGQRITGQSCPDWLKMTSSRLIAATSVGFEQ